MNDVDISRNHGHGTVPVPGRESHTADLREFDRYVSIMEHADRLEQDLKWDEEEDDDDDDEGSFSDSYGGGSERDGEDSAANRAAAPADAGGAVFYKPMRSNPPQDVPIGMDVLTNGDAVEAAAKMGEMSLSNGDSDHGLETGPHYFHKQASELSDIATRKTEYPFNAKFWAYIRSILSNAKPVGFGELPNPNATAVKGPEDATNFISKVVSIGPLNPIQPAVIAQEGGFDEDVVLAELFYGTLVGLVAMRFSPVCVQCGSAVMDTDMLGRVPGKAMCQGCNAPNVVDNMDNIKVMFLLNSDVLYVLAENYACTPSSDSMAVTNIFAAVPANSTGSGYTYRVGTGKETEIAPALAPGKYRMHCPVAKTDNYLVVERKAKETDPVFKLNMKVSQLVYNHKRGQRRAELRAPHGKIQFDIFPDTRSFFVLWVQKDVDDKTLMYLPEDERQLYTSATRVIHHPIFNALFQENQVVSVQKNIFLSISHVVLVFTDIVDSTKLYASLGDGHAFRLVRKHFQVLFGAFTRNGGRVVKTIGDAVMASFTTGKAALHAVSEAMILMPTIGRRPDNQNFVEIRVGIHSGQATVVPLNGVNDYFGQTANIAARVQSAAKASECFVTETVLESSQEARYAYNEITAGSSFQATPVTELKLKGVEGKVHARGFRKTVRSRRESDTSSLSHYTDRKANRSYSIRRVSESSLTGTDDEQNDIPRVKQFERPGELGRRGSQLDVYEEE